VTYPTEIVGEEFGRATTPAKAFKSFSPINKPGLLDISATLIGYSEDVLAAAKAKTPVKHMPFLIQWTCTICEPKQV